MRALRSTRVCTKPVQEMHLQATGIFCRGTAHSVNTSGAGAATGTCIGGASSEDGACSAYGIEAGVTQSRCRTRG